MLIVADPKLLLVDEPAAGLTDTETELTAELLLELKGQPHDHRHRARHGLRPPAGLPRDRA